MHGIMSSVPAEAVVDLLQPQILLSAQQDARECCLNLDSGCLHVNCITSGIGG